MRQPDRLVLHPFPARVKATDVVGHIARHEPVLTPLHFLLQPLAVINERRLFARKQVCAHHSQQHKQATTKAVLESICEMTHEIQSARVAGGLVSMGKYSARQSLSEIGLIRWRTV